MKKSCFINGSLLMSAVLSLSNAQAAPSPFGNVTSQQRQDYLSKAQVWNADGLSLDQAIQAVASKDIVQGAGKADFTTGETVECDYFTPTKPGRLGTSPKFRCTLPTGTKLASGKVLLKPMKLKVKYRSSDPNADNWEALTEAPASRLLWALGFGADKHYSVKVVCKNCPADPWHGTGAAGTRTYEPADIGLDLKGEGIAVANGKEEWKWAELVAKKASGADMKAQVDAMLLAATFLGYADNDAPKQRLICLEGTTDCTKPFMYMHGTGASFGDGTAYRLSLTNWSLPIWKDSSKCVANLDMHLNKISDFPNHGNPQISEGGRKLLADLLSKLSDSQIYDIFDSGRLYFDPASVGAGHHMDVSTEKGKQDLIKLWVDAFSKKRADIVNAHCPTP